MDGFLRGAWEELFEQWDEVRQGAVLWKPVLPTAAWSSPVVALGGLLALAILTGVSLVALGVLITALFAAHLVLAQVFGISIEVALR